MQLGQTHTERKRWLSAKSVGKRLLRSGPLNTAGHTPLGQGICLCAIPGGLRRFICQDLVMQARIPVEALPESRPILGLNGDVLTKMYPKFRVAKCKPVAESDLVGPEARSCVPRRFLLDNSLLRDFYSAHPDRPGRAPGGAR
ncbi:hypothetical protein D4764_13G0012650 [Takifugu flavidus]|uniref:Uncharacterized protein n=1 Tax=Takifugu flavidus TaxID=433684 RepID=A0A5C6PAR4_9TELE|nr:hypothetical protein D4764_13G0012650 [Takifugu flavidus]